MSSENAEPTRDAAGPPRAGFLERHAGKLVLSVVITLLIWYAMHRGGLKYLPEGGDFHSVRWWILPIYAASLLALNWFRSIRWRFLLKSIAARVTNGRLFAISLIGFAAIVIVPFRIGEIVRPMLLRTPPKQRLGGAADEPITLTAATSSVIAERVIDGLYLSLVLALALWLVPTVHPLPERVVGIPVSVAHVRFSGYMLLVAFTGAFGVIALFYFARSWAHRATFAVVGRFSQSLAEKLAETFEKVADGLHVLGSWRNAAGFVLETTLYWGINALGIWLMAWGCGVVHADGSGPDFGEACALLGMLGCAIIIPGPPGMLGVFQAGLYAAMTMYYPTAIVTGPGAACVFLLYVTQVVFALASGFIALFFEQDGLEVLEQA